MANNTGKKFGGRKKGTPNLITSDLRGILQTFIENNLDNMQSDFEKLNAYQRFNVLEKLLKLVLPPLVTDLSQLSEENLDILIKRLRDEQKE